MGFVNFIAFYWLFYWKSEGFELQVSLKHCNSKPNKAFSFFPHGFSIRKDNLDFFVLDIGSVDMLKTKFSILFVLAWVFMLIKVFIIMAHNRASTEPFTVVLNGSHLFYIFGLI